MGLADFQHVLHATTYRNQYAELPATTYHICMYMYVCTLSQNHSPLTMTTESQYNEWPDLFLYVACTLYVMSIDCRVLIK